jgi:hypothetical protein
MKGGKNFFRISHNETRRFIVLLAVVEFIALLVECAKLFNNGMPYKSLLLFLVGITGIWCVDKCFNRSIDRYKEVY